MHKMCLKERERERKRERAREREKGDANGEFKSHCLVGKSYLNALQGLAIVGLAIWS